MIDQDQVQDKAVILVVDDEPEERLLIRSALADGGYEFHEAKDGREAVERFKRTKFDLILMDVTMPNMDGFEACSLIKRLPGGAETPLLMITGMDDEQSVQRAFSIGASDYLTKPICWPVTKHRVRRILAAARSEVALNRSRESLRNLAVRLQEIREEERTKIAREIHDEFGQALTSLRIDLSWLMDRLSKTEQTLYERALAMVSIIDETIDNVRRVSSSLRPAVLDDLGLVAAIEWMAQGFMDRTGIECKLSLQEEGLEFVLERDTVAFRIFQEALTNIARHSEASNAWIVLRVSDDELLLKITDDGSGISEEALSSSRSIGLIGMHERAAALGGRVSIDKVDPKGTCVTLTLPLAENQSSETVGNTFRPPD